MPPVARYPKHCFDEMSGDQRGEDYRCCFCNVPQREWSKEGHGPYYKGTGTLVDHSDEDCPQRLAVRLRDIEGR